MIRLVFSILACIAAQEIELVDDLELDILRATKQEVFDGDKFREAIKNSTGIWAIRIKQVFSEMFEPLVEGFKN